MAWNEIKRMAEHHQKCGWMGIVLPVEQVLSLEDELLGPVRALGQQVALALLDHDLERLRALAHQIRHYGEEAE